MTLDEARAHIGAGVIYDPGYGQTKEDGTIVSVSKSLVFVTYVGDRGPKATYAQDLRLLVDVTS